jgi:hypothetical protein
MDEIEEMLGNDGDTIVDPANEKVVVDPDKTVVEDTNTGGLDNNDNGADVGDKEDNPLNQDNEDRQKVNGAETDAFDVAKHFEGFESLDQVKEAVGRSKQYTTDVEEELATLRTRSDSFSNTEKELTELKGRQPYKNVKFYQLDKLSESDPDKAEIYQKYLFGDNSDEAIIKLKMMADHPARFKENPGFLQRQLKAKYSDYLGDEFTNEDVEYLDAKTQLGIDADEARTIFESKIGEVDIPKIKSEEDVKTENETFFKGWQQPFAKVKENLTKLSLPVLDEKDSSKTVEYMDYDIPKEDLQAVYNAAGNHVAQMRLEPTQENMDQATKVALGVYLINNFAKINTSFANQLAKETGAKWRKRVNNPQKPGADNGVINKSTDGPLEGSGEDVYNQIMSD